MEAILPGSSREIVRFLTSHTLLRQPPLSSPPLLSPSPQPPPTSHSTSVPSVSGHPENPYSIASPEALYNETSNHYFQIGTQAQNYLEPISSEGNIIERSTSPSHDPVHCGHTADTRPGAIAKPTPEHQVPAGAIERTGTSASPRFSPSSTAMAGNRPCPSSSANINYKATRSASDTPHYLGSSGRQEAHRQTFGHGPREQQHNGTPFVRSLTERAVSKSPVQLYVDQEEEDGGTQDRVSPLPPSCPPGHTSSCERKPKTSWSGGSSKSSSVESSEHLSDNLSPEDWDSITMQDLQLSTSSKSDYDFPKSLSTEKVLEGTSPAPPEQQSCPSPSGSLRPVPKPRRPKPKPKPEPPSGPSEHVYLEVMPEHYSDPVDGGSVSDSGGGDDLDLSKTGLSQEALQNLNEEQRGVLRKMFLQASDPQKAPPSPSSTSSLPVGQAVRVTRKNKRTKSQEGIQHISTRESNWYSGRLVGVVGEWEW